MKRAAKQETKRPTESTVGGSYDQKKRQMILYRVLPAVDLMMAFFDPSLEFTAWDPETFKRYHRISEKDEAHKQVERLMLITMVEKIMEFNAWTNLGQDNEPPQFWFLDHSDLRMTREVCKAFPDASIHVPNPNAWKFDQKVVDSYQPALHLMGCMSFQFTERLKRLAKHAPESVLPRYVLVWYDACGTMRECDLKSLCIFFILQLFARSVSLVAVTFSYRGIAGHSVQSITERIREELAVHHSRLVLLRLAPYKNSMFTAIFLVMDATVSPLAERKLVDMLNTTIASASKAPKTVKSTNASTAKKSGLKRQKTVESSEMSDSAETIESRAIEVASGQRTVSPEFLPGDVVLCNMSNKAGWEEFKRCHLEGVIMAQISKSRYNIKLKNSGMGVVEVGSRRLTKLARRPVTLNQMPELPPKASRVLAKLLTGDNIGWWEARVVRYADDEKVFLKFGSDDRRIVSTRDCILKSR